MLALLNHWNDELPIPMHIIDYIETAIDVLPSEGPVQCVFKSKKFEFMKMYAFECSECSQTRRRQDCASQGVFSNDHQGHQIHCQWVVRTISMKCLTSNALLVDSELCLEWIATCRWVLCRKRRNRLPKRTFNRPSTTTDACTEHPGKLIKPFHILFEYSRIE